MKRATAQMALEALKGLWIQKPGGGLNGDSMSMHCANAARQAIAAIEAEIAQSVNPVLYVNKQEIEGFESGDSGWLAGWSKPVGSFQHPLYAAPPAEAINAELFAELQNIANANPKNWDAPYNDTPSFQAWAQSRARAAVAKATGGAA